MGWGIGIGIGWPNASSSGNIEPDTYFIIDAYCNGKPIPPGGTTTQFVSSAIYNTGDYVYAENQLSRVLLGTKTDIEATTENISGPSYNSCG